MTDATDLSALTEVADRLVAAARTAGADDADAVVVHGTALSVSVREGKVEETERSESADLGLRVFVGRRSAVVSANLTEDPKALAERAVAMARTAATDSAVSTRKPRFSIALARRLTKAASSSTSISVLSGPRSSGSWFITRSLNILN